MSEIIPASDSIEEVIQNLQKSIKNDEIKEYFGRQVDHQKIELFEAAFCVQLPVSFKTFLTQFNGGFIADSEAESMILTDEYDEAKRISTRILSIDEIIEEYEYMQIDDWKLKPDFEGFYPYIPFCITADNEKLVFVDNFKQGTESNVYAAFHDDPASAWFIVANDFTEFIADFINSGGKPNLYKLEAELFAEDYLYLLDDRKEELENPKERIKRNTAYLMLFPKSADTYTNRAIAYRDCHQYEKALADFNKSVELDEGYALTYYCRGSMLLSLDKARQALTDLDSACQIQPDDPFYLVGRADAFYALNKMDEALADCNRAIEIDDRYELAYMTRYNIYLYLGEGLKAEADAAMIDQLMSEEN